MKKTSINKKKISKECWSLDYHFIKWINEHCKVYLKEADKFVDLTYHKFNYKDKEYTQKELIRKLIKITDEALSKDILLDTMEYFEEICDIWKLIGPAMWW